MLIGCAVHFLLTGEEALDCLVALGVVCGQHLGKLDDPVSLELFIDLAGLQILQVIGEPFVLDSQEPEKGRFPGSLVTDYTDDIVELRAGPEGPCDGPQHEELHDLIGIVAVIGTEEVSEGIADSRLAVPFQAVQEIPDRMVGVAVRHDADCFLDKHFGSDPIGPVTVQMEVEDIVVCQGRAVAPALPAHRFHHIDPLCQLVIPDTLAEKRIIGQDHFRV